MRISIRRISKGLVTALGCAAILAAATAVGVGLDQAKADSASASRGRAVGLARIIAYADQCGFAVDQGKLKQYAGAAGLDTPEALAMIGEGVDNVFFAKTRASPSECTLLRMAGSKIGVVAPGALEGDKGARQ